MSAPRGNAQREARLRPEFAACYPGLRAGEWAPAAVVADRVLAQSLLRASDGIVRGRVLLEHLPGELGQVCHDY